MAPLRALVGAKIYTVTRGTFERGTILIRDGKIEAVGTGFEAPADAEIIDVTGRVATPGFIDAHCHVGLYEEGLGWEGDDTNEITDPVTPHIRAIDGINPLEQGLRDALMGGVTAAWVTPGSANVLGGEGATIKTHGQGRTVEQMILKAPSGLKAATGENPKRVYGRNNKKAPATRMAIAAMLRETLLKARSYMEKQERYRDQPEKRPDYDVKLESVARVLRGEIPLRCHAHRADDIITAARIAEEFGIGLCIEHCTEGHLVAEELARRQIPCIVGPSLVARVKVELRERTLQTPGILARAGVKVAIMTDHPVIPIDHLVLAAQLAVREGMNETDALKAITIHAAEISGVADRVGSLEVGKDADIAVHTGDPMDFRSRTVMTLVDGEIVYRRDEHREEHGAY